MNIYVRNWSSHNSFNFTDTILEKLNFLMLIANFM